MSPRTWTLTDYRAELARDQDSFGYPPNLGTWPDVDRKRCLEDCARFSEVIVAESDHLVGGNSLADGPDDFGAGWENWEAPPRKNGDGRARDSYEAPGTHEQAASVVDAGTFLRSYEPLSYTIDGVLPTGFLYGLTGRRGHAKTAKAIATTIACIKGDEAILGHRVKQGRVAYITKENPTDFKMKLAVNCYVHGLSYDDIAPMVAVIAGGNDSPEAIVEGLRCDAERNGPFVLAVYDTFQAGFDGNDFNANAEVLKFLTRLRPLTTVPGYPAALVLMHPTKNAGEDELFPYGGGSIMNEFDGNLTVWTGNGATRFWWNKVRGPEFEPVFFRIEKLSSPDIMDIEGRQILLPVLRPMDEAAAEAREKSHADTSRALLEAMARDPAGSQRNWAMAIQKSKGAVCDCLQKLKKQGFAVDTLGNWGLTRKGHNAVKVEPGNTGQRPGNSS